MQRCCPKPRPPRNGIKQLVGWFEPRTRRPQSVELWQSNGKREELTLAQQNTGYAEVNLFANQVRVGFGCQTVTAPPPLPTPAASQRTLYVALTAAHDHTWHDGYLVHFAADGQVLSLLTQPGDARLLVPLHPCGYRGVNPHTITMPTTAHYLRLCLRAHIASFCRHHELQGKFTIALDNNSLTAMVCTVLLASLHPISVHNCELTPPWLRLLQNLGVPRVMAKPALAISMLHKLMPPAATIPIAQDINNQATVIPSRAVTAGQP